MLCLYMPFAVLEHAVIAIQPRSLTATRKNGITLN